MASTSSASSSSVQKHFKYDVFLSFRGEDTRKNFVDHLFHALVSKGVTTYKDDERIKKGERIDDQLITSIQESRFHIIVFSKNYASSSWCLDELVKIMECHKTSEQTAYPIFYDVEPTEVRNQSGAVGEAFERLIRKIKRKRTLEDVDLEKEDDIRRPRNALKEAVVEKQKEAVGEVFANHVDKEGGGRWRDALKEAAGLAGWELKNTVDGHEAKFIEKIMEEILPKLYFINSSVDENLVGMESRVNKIVSSLEIGMDSVRLIGIKGMGGGGKTTLARAVYDHISIQFEGKSFVADVREGSKGSGLKDLQKRVLQNVLSDKSIDVESVYDGKSLMKKMMPGRKVLIVLDDVDHIDQLKALADSPNWFKRGSKIIITTRDEQVLKAHGVHFIHDVSLLSDDEAICLFCRYAFKNDIPIQGYEEPSRKVIRYANGLPLTVTVLGSFLYDRTVCEWEDAIERLKSIPEHETLKRLELSYDGLEKDYKEIFLDVACILRGESKDKAVRILESCGFNAKIGLSVLEQKSLITISLHGRLLLHDLIVEMGQNIVRRLHPDEPSKHSRLWMNEEIEDILIKQLDTEAIRCMKLHFLNLHPTTIMEGLRNMKELRFLYVAYKDVEAEELCQYLPSTIRCLRCENIPTLMVRDDIQMVERNIFELRERGKRQVLNRLGYLELIGLKLRTFNLGMTPNLKTLNLDRCYDFVELHMPTECPNLKSIDLSNSKLRTFNLGMTPNLETLDIALCYDFVELHMPTECPNLKSIDLSNSKLRTFNLGMTPNLKTLNLDRCYDFVELHMPTECPNLKSINLCWSKLRTFNIGMIPNLEKLNLKGCEDFVELHMPSEHPNLKYVNLHHSKLRTFDLMMTPNLEKLDLGGCSDFVELHVSHECPNLKYLGLNVSKVGNLNLGLTPYIETLELDGCNEFIEPHILEAVDRLEHLTLSFREIKHLPHNICLLKHLKSLELSTCGRLEQLPKDLDRLECLEKLNLWKCSSLQEIPNNICKMKCLKYLSLSHCRQVEELPEDIGRLKCLKDLNIVGAGINRLPQSIFELKGLRIEGSREQLQSYGFSPPHDGVICSVVVP